MLQRAPRSAEIRVVRAESLYTSEPDPRMFGNQANARSDRAWTNDNWLKSRFHFSFAEYGGGPSNFGVLRVMNDDLVQPARGFGTHGHRDMEIVTYVVEGELTHADSGGNAETLGRGAIQFMSAGQGVRHSEHNRGAKPLRFIQSWIVPRRRGLAPAYGSASDFDRIDKWAKLVGDAADASDDAPVKVEQDVSVSATELSPGKCLDLRLGAARQAYLLAVEGAVTLASEKTTASLTTHDAAELKGPLSLELSAGAAGAHLLIFEMAATGDGRADAVAAEPRA